MPRAEPSRRRAARRLGLASLAAVLTVTMAPAVRAATTSGSSPAPAAPPAASAVAASGLQFLPPDVPLVQGGSLTFVQLEVLFAPHNVTSDVVDPVTGRPLFQSATLELPQATAPVVGVGSLAPGSYGFHCTVHPFMQGTLLVSAPPAVSAASSRAPVTVTGTTTGSSADWPMYGHDLANTRTSSGGPPGATVPNLKPLWRLDVTDGDFTATPVVVGGTVYIGSNGGLVRAVDAAKGTVTWTTQVSGPVNGTVAVDGSEVIVPVATPSSPSVVALDAGDGHVLWQTVLDNTLNADVYGSPVVASGVVYIGVSGVNGDPNGSLRGSVVALNEVTGIKVWQTYTVAQAHNGGAVWSTPAIDVAANKPYVGTGNAYSGTVDPQTDSILELDLNLGGQVVNHYQATGGDAFSTGSGGSVGPDFDFGASPNLLSVGGVPMVGEGQKAGAYWVLPRNLDASQAQSLQLGPGSPVGGIIGSTAYDGQNIYGPISAPGYVWSAGFTAGHLLANWLSPGVADPVHFSPVVTSQGVVYSTDSSGFLDAWSAADGAPLAHIALNILPPDPSTYALAFGGVSVAEGMVFADTGSQAQNGSLVAFAPA